MIVALRIRHACYPLLMKGQLSSQSFVSQGCVTLISAGGYRSLSESLKARSRSSVVFPVKSIRGRILGIVMNYNFLFQLGPR